MPDEGRPPRALIACLCASFVAIGTSIASIGPALPDFARGARIDISEIGVLFSALFAGMLASQITAGLLMDRIGTRVVTLGGMALFGAGAVAISGSPRLAALLPASAVLGVGYGFGTIASNLIASRLLTHRPAFVLNLINVLYGCGTVIGPLLTSVVLGSGGQARWVPAIGGVMLLALLPWAARVLPDDAGTPLREAIRERSSARLARPLLLIGALVFLYGGVEAGFGGWLATYVERTLSVAPSRAALLTSVYWLSYVSGRIVATALVFRVGPGRVLEGALTALTAGAVVLALAVGHAAGTTTGIVLVGAATGPIYPAMFGVVTLRFANRAAFAVSLVAAMGSVGAMVLPWAMGLTVPLGGGRVLAASPLLLGVGMWGCYRVSGLARQSSVSGG